MTKEITKKIRNDLKALKGFKFSVRTEYFSGGSSITISVIKSPIRLVKNVNEIPEHVYKNYNNIPVNELEKYQSSGYHQINHYQLMDDYNDETYCNGVFLTEMGHNKLKEIVEIVNKYHWDKSDVQVDHFDTNFYFHLELGKYDKKLIEDN